MLAEPELGESAETRALVAKGLAGDLVAEHEAFLAARSATRAA